MKKRSNVIAGILSVSMILSVLGGNLNDVGLTRAAETELSAFEQEFKSPNNDAKPFMRYWIAPGRMNEEQVRREMEAFALGGFGGVELQSLELAKGSVINDQTWNETMKWILRAGRDFGIQVDFTIGQLWPIATPAINDIDDDRTEQRIYSTTVDFSATAQNMEYAATEYVFPDAGSGFASGRKHELIAITAAMKLEDGTYDPTTAVSLLGEESNFDEASGAISWSAPQEGEWSIFYFYRQSSGATTMIVGQYVIDHMSAAATKAVTDNWDEAMNCDSELKSLYEQNGGSIFGDSFELRSNLWTVDMLQEFAQRRGYDLTPWLPAIHYEMNSIGNDVREDLYKTMTELLANNHMHQFSDWAKGHNMTLRYQAYSSAGSSVFELTEPAFASDIIEAESYAMSGSAPDAYRQLSGVVNMRGDNLYTVEGVEIGQDAWRNTWLETKRKNGESHHRGYMYYANRFYAAGVNKAIFHGTTYKMTDTEGLGMPPWMPADTSWPGYSAMSLMSYGNEWDDKTPMWDNVDIMTDSISRTQMVLQQGQGDVDLAVYRNLHGKGNVRNDITAVEQNGYTYDYVTPFLLDLDNAVVGMEDNRAVLAADGPSYKALIIEPMNDGTVPKMSLHMAEKILDYAHNGLPVVIIGEAPSQVDGYIAKEGIDPVNGQAEENTQLADYMNQLKTLDNVKSIGSREELAANLAQLGVTPDMQPEAPQNIYSNHRHTADAELYFLYNDGSEDSTQKLTLKGYGKPYLLDPWSGDITPIVSYVDNNGTITMDAQIEAMSTMMVAIAQEGWSSHSISNQLISTNADEVIYDRMASTVALRSYTGGEISAEMSDGTKISATTELADEARNLNNWQMILEQWKPGETAHDTIVEDTNSYDLSEIGLVPWYDIDAQNLTKAAGVAKYTTSFELNKGWEEGQGAILSFDNAADVMRLFVNDIEVPLNQLTLKADIGPYLKAGNNTIVARVSSNVSNVKYANNDNDTYAFGIVGEVKLEPYVHVRALGEVLPEISIQGPEALPEGKIGQDYSATISALGDNIEWSVDGKLPKGLSFTEGSINAEYVLKGVPTEAGIFKFTVSIKNSSSSASKEYTLTVVGDKQQAPKGDENAKTSQLAKTNKTKTGDTNRIWIALGLLILSSICLVIVILRRRKRRLYKDL
ncbi:glycosyl hydrolase [Ohessyouella blattaphilus]|uniref:Ig domain-containing protein n=1 Tax=Ohessyouella blattaphilus TaxID=2949333 RepID=A0ABT1EKZ3_9FIRM|nr:glycosyl hydrolase [Ohessyouella blattaphilus]MCP1110442.1 putative Ig domain-containing protein [Ohessyouella blattaphilus]MCR8563836.1 putative Ig domain-containing protein [Ohessyouella blattaphilus]